MVRSELVDIVMIGVGPMAAQHARAISGVDGLRITSCASRDQTRAEAFAAEHGIPHAKILEDVLAHPEGDALWICVSADAMAESATLFGSLGLPMFLEKPVGLSLAETNAIRDNISVPHMVGLNRRFYEVIRHGVDQISANGGLRAIEIHMPEDVMSVPAKHGPHTRRHWQFANSVHLIDLFRFLAGEPADILTMNEVRSDSDRAYNALIRFEGGARGIFNAQWYAPGGWRVVLYADDLSVIFQPIEVGEVRRRGSDPIPLLPADHDLKFKPGLWGQATAFRDLVANGRKEDGLADLADYAGSVALVEKLTSEN